MISFPAGSRIWLVAGVTDMRNGFNGLAARVQSVLNDDPFSGHLFIFRGRRADMIKLLWADEDGLCLFVKRLERGRFVWPAVSDGKIHLTPAQLTTLLEGHNWKRHCCKYKNGWVSFR
ncbi:IS66 family insertion sequence element accessory protein TnpB [Serratia marcescens]|uniref:IS66 family insertion sequence element accessory protein TnpB n=1 Tax=Serratia marcescens TaxID=615 RepID=UPI001747814D